MRALRSLCSSGDRAPVFLVFVVFVVMAVLKLHSVKEHYRIEYERVEESDIDCYPIWRGKREAIKYKEWKPHYEHIQQELEHSDEICSLLNKYFLFEKFPLSKEEKEFPLAFGYLVHWNVIQVLLQLSIMYQPQNYYCISVDNWAEMSFKNILLKIPRCFTNVRVQIGEAVSAPWNKMGVVNNMYECLMDLTNPAKQWKYYQLVNGEDFPLKTNLEMVRILKALNGTINTDIYPFSSWRYGIRRELEPPLTMYQGSIGVALPRQAADFFMERNETKEFLIYLEKIHLPHETFWATLAANKKKYRVPGAIDGEELEFIRQFNDYDDEERNDVSSIGKTSITRYDIMNEKNCYYCLFELEDIPDLLIRPEIFAHRFSLFDSPAVYICMAKEHRRRSNDELQLFDAENYSIMPTVELGSGKRPAQLSRPEWIRVNRTADKYD